MNMSRDSADFDAAVGEARAYNRMGGLDEAVLKSIAHDFGVDYRDILEELDWGRDYYD